MPRVERLIYFISTSTEYMVTARVAQLESLISALRNRELRRRSSRNQNSRYVRAATHTCIHPRMATMGRRMHSTVPLARTLMQRVPQVKVGGDYIRRSSETATETQHGRDTAPTGAAIPRIGFVRGLR